MGWASGSEFVSRVAKRVAAVVEHPGQKRAIFDELVAVALDGGCDTLDECRGIDSELDAAIGELWGLKSD